VANDKVLVTGASGFVGGAVARALIGEGHDVRALVRSSSNRRNLDGLSVELVEGDMRDPVAVTAAMAGVRWLFHVAADYRLWTRDPAELLRTNREGTRTIMRAALTAGVERIVYTSSVATLACRADGAPADETDQLCAEAAIGAYKRSKVEAEQVVAAMVADEGLPAIIVHPSTPIGPGDVKPTPTGRILVEAALGRVPGFVDTGLNIVHVDDVAAGHLMALHKGRPGERFILGGQDVSLADLLGVIADLCGRKPPRLKLPRALLYPIAVATEVVARTTKREPFLTVDGLRMSKNRMFFTSAKAERVLGYQARPYREALVDALAWFEANGYLR
jgi:dihydroflavonol-4-reductase